MGNLFTKSEHIKYGVPVPFLRWLCYCLRFGIRR